MMNNEQWWYFTFGYGQDPGIGYYTKYYGTYESARDQQVRLHGQRWCFQYDEDAFKPQIKEYNLKEFNG